MVRYQDIDYVLTIDRLDNFDGFNFLCFLFSVSLCQVFWSETRQY